MCSLPLSVAGMTRSELLRTYQEFKGKDYDPEDLHEALDWKKGDAPKMPPVQILSGWTLVGKDLKPVKTDTQASPPSKRKNNSQGGKSLKRARTQPAVIKPSAIMWDRINYSCAYDAYSPFSTTYGRSTLQNGQNIIVLKQNTLDSCRQDLINSEEDRHH
jgi:hypothetical protein